MKPNPRKALIVDDSPEVCRIVSEMMCCIGFEAVSACSVASAMVTFDEAGRSFDLLITDLAMPGALGFEAAERVRRFRPDLPVIFISGIADASLLEFVIGCHSRTAVLMKPFSTQDLRLAVLDLCVTGAE